MLSINCSSIENPAIIYILSCYLKLVELAFFCRTQKIIYNVHRGFQAPKILISATNADFFCLFVSTIIYTVYELFNDEHHKSGSYTHSYETIHSCKDVTNSLELTGMGFWFYTINFSLYWLQNGYTSNEYILRAQKTLTFRFLHALLLSLKPTIPQLTSHQPLALTVYNVLVCPLEL